MFILYLQKTSYSNLYVGLMYDDIRLHVARSYISSAASRQSLLFDIIPHSVQPSSPKASLSSFSLVLSFSSPYFLRSAPLFSSRVHIGLPLRHPFLDFLCGFPTFVVLLSILSFLILSTSPAHIHRSIFISPTSNISFFMSSSMPMSLPRTPVPVLQLSNVL